VNVVVNGAPQTVSAELNLEQLVRSLVESERGVAVSVDREIVPRSSWATRRLHEGALVEVLVAAAGG
jgi:sulfur carrier protein